MNSMTGFGRAETTIGRSQITVELRSVNHRYLDTRFRMPGPFSWLEAPFTARLQERFARGSFDVTLRHRLTEAQGEALLGTRYVVDEIAAKSLAESLAALSKRFTPAGSPPAGPTPEAWLASRALVPVEDVESLEAAQKELIQVFDAAASELARMRAAEGKRLKAILRADVESLGQVASGIRARAPEQSKKVAESLKKRIEQWKLAPPMDPGRLDAEVVLHSERSDFTEEVDRLVAHREAFLELIEEDGPIGRKLDFLTQELHRELNTLGAKAAMPEVSRLAVEGKTIVEKLRQQVQNVE